MVLARFDRFVSDVDNHHSCCWKLGMRSLLKCRTVTVLEHCSSCLLLLRVTRVQSYYSTYMLIRHTGVAFKCFGLRSTVFRRLSRFTTRTWRRLSAKTRCLALSCECTCPKTTICYSKYTSLPFPMKMKTWCRHNLRVNFRPSALPWCQETRRSVQWEHGI